MNPLRSRPAKSARFRCPVECEQYNLLMRYSKLARHPSSDQPAQPFAECCLAHLLVALSQTWSDLGGAKYMKAHPVPPLHGPGSTRTSVLETTRNSPIISAKTLQASFKIRHIILIGIFLNDALQLFHLTSCFGRNFFVNVLKHTLDWRLLCLLCR